MTDKDIPSCPFCGGEASLKTKEERAGYDDYMRHDAFLYVSCLKCGAQSADFRIKPLCETTPYKVQDFRNNPALRARVEDEYDVYLEQLEQEVIRAWSKRTPLTDYDKGYKDAFEDTIEWLESNLPLDDYLKRVVGNWYEIDGDRLLHDFKQAMRPQPQEDNNA